MEERRERRKFDKEYKLDVVRLIVEGGQKATQVSRDLDIDVNLIYKWKREYLADTQGAFPGKGRLKPDDERIRNLEKRLRDVEMERDILKKAVAIFSKPPK